MCDADGDEDRKSVWVCVYVCVSLRVCVYRGMCLYGRAHE